MIVFSFPEFLALILLLTALLAFLFRRWEPWTALASSLVTAGLALWIWLSYPLASLYTFPLLPVSVNFGGRVSQFDFALHLHTANLPIVVLSLVLASLALLLAALVHQGDFFTPITLLILLGYEGIALLQGAPLEPVLIIPLFLALLSAVGVFLLQGEHFGQIGGPLRSMLAPVLAFPFFLPVAWYVAEIPLNPQNNETFQVAGWLLAVGLLLLLAPAPLHSGQPSAAQSASPVGMLLLTLLSQLAILSLLYRVVTRFSFVVELAPLNLWLTVGGVVTAIWGGVAAIGANHPGRLWGYALLHNWGLILLILAVPGPQSWPLVIFLFALRSISALTAVAGLTQLREVVGRLDAPEQLQGAGSRLPWSSAAFLLGSLGLAGFPLSAGFTGHWAALQIVADSDWRVAAAVLIASGGVVFGFVRLVRILFGPLQDRFLPQERLIGAVVAVIALVISASMAISPQLLQGPVTWALVAFTR
jgi:formate hydrogenlyase subunit 3/multisubunit Na+/H+ antiporter MnhD subunit